MYNANLTFSYIPQASSIFFIAQIEEKGYAKPSANDPRKLFKIGVGFSTGNRRIKDRKVVAGPDFDLES